MEKFNKKKLSIWPIILLILFFIIPFIVLLYYNSIIPIPQKDIFLFTMDALRADRMGFSGYNNAYTPNFDLFSKKSMLFQSVTTTSPETLPAHASLFTGRYPWQHGCLDNRYPLTEKEKTIAEILKGAGYKTIAVTNAILTLHRGFEQGFDFFNDDKKNTEMKKKKKQVFSPFVKTKLQFNGTKSGKRIDYFSAEKTTNRVIKTIHSAELNSDRPLFLWAHYWDTHAPYNPPELYRKLFNCQKGGGRDFFFPIERRKIHELQIKISKHDIKRLNALYDGEAAYLDHEWGRLISVINSKKNAKKALFIVIADHGEALYDKNYYIGHGLSIRNDVIKVPLLIKTSELHSGIADYSVESIDVLPTILAIVKIDNLVSNLTGRNLLKRQKRTSVLKLDKRREIQRSRAQLIQKSCIQNEHWKIVLQDKVKSAAIYNLASDPAELMLSRENNSELKYLLNMARLWQKHFLYVQSPAKNTKDEEKLKKMLYSLGYIAEMKNHKETD